MGNLIDNALKYSPTGGAISVRVLRDEQASTGFAVLAVEDHGPAPSPVVLVVDDDPDIVHVIKGALEDEGLTVETASDGGQALAAAERRQPDLVVLDVTLPVVDGFEVAARLRSVQQRVAPVLAITADGQAAQKATRLGAYAYLRKPFELSDLIAIVWRGLGRPEN